MIPDLVSDLMPDEREIFNWLTEQHPHETGKPLSLREIGKKLGISHDTVMRRKIN